MTSRNSFGVVSALIIASLLAPQFAQMAAAKVSATDKARIERAKSLIFTEVTLKAEADLANAEDEYQKDAAKRRGLCRKVLLTANKEEALIVVLKCTAKDFEQERALLAKQAATMPIGISAKTSASYKDAIEKLSTALNALIEATTRDVFRDEKTLRTALQNLRVKYRVPYYEARAAVRSERRLAGVSLIITKAMSVTGSTILDANWKLGLTCLQAKENELLGTGSILAGSGKTMDQCMKLLITPVVSSGAIK